MARLAWFRLHSLASLCLVVAMSGCFDDPQDGGTEGLAGVDALADGGDVEGQSCEGDLGCPCKSDEQCKSGYCKDGLCADPCGGPCPEGQVCKNVGEDGDKQFICVEDPSLPNCVTETGGEICDGKDNDCDGQTDELSCDDDNACTLDTCDPSAQESDKCSYETLKDTICSDGDPCTAGDTCKAGQCSAGTPKNCDDDSVCTQDSCDSALGGCINQSIGGSCDDGNPCTVSDACKDGVCAGDGPDCDDDNPCTTDPCSVSAGCSN
ncbi:MAG TPA: hypothetical protein DCQ06_09870, partial [Myxococcales bacterium]|nr:hypothetical protein [Myxococcales bacterium]